MTQIGGDDENPTGSDLEALLNSVDLPQDPNAPKPVIARKATGTVRVPSTGRNVLIHFGSEPPFPATIYDASKTGVSVFSPKRLFRGDAVKIDFPADASIGTLSFRVEAVHQDQGVIKGGIIKNNKPQCRISFAFQAANADEVMRYGKALAILMKR